MIKAAVSSDHVFIMICEKANIQMPLHEFHDDIEASFIVRFLARSEHDFNKKSNLGSTVKRMGVQCFDSRSD